MYAAWFAVRGLTGLPATYTFSRPSHSLSLSSSGPPSSSVSATMRPDSSAIRSSTPWREKFCLSAAARLRASSTLRAMVTAPRSPETEMRPSRAVMCTPRASRSIFRLRSAGPRTV